MKLSSSWFDEWVDQNLSISFTVTDGPDATGTLVAFGAGSERHPQTREEADNDQQMSSVRVGTIGSSTYAIERFSVVGSTRQVLEDLSRGNHMALNLTYTPTANSLGVAIDGQRALMFELSMPDERYGNDPNRFDDELVTAGVVGSDRVRPSSGLKFVELVTGIMLTREMVEMPLRAASLPQLL